MSYSLTISRITAGFQQTFLKRSLYGASRITQRSVSRLSRDTMEKYLVAYYNSVRCTS